MANERMPELTESQRSGWGVSVVILLSAAQMLGFAGFMSGYFDRTAAGLEWHEFVWDLETTGYTIAMVAACIATIFLLFKSDEDSNLKFGTTIFVSVPFVAFLALFFDLVHLGPQ